MDGNFRAGSFFTASSPPDMVDMAMRLKESPLFQTKALPASSRCTLVPGDDNHPFFARLIPDDIAIRPPK